MVGTAGGYAYLSVNAFNAWALVGSGGAPSLAESLAWSDDTRAAAGADPRRGHRRRAARRRLPLGRRARRGPRRPLDAARGRRLPGHRLLHPAHARPRALHLPGRRPPAAPGRRLGPLGRGAAAAQRGRLHQPPRHPDRAALRHGQRDRPAPRRVVPEHAAGGRLGAAADGRGPLGGLAAAALAAHAARTASTRWPPRPVGTQAPGHGRRRVPRSHGGLTGAWTAPARGPATSAGHPASRLPPPAGHGYPAPAVQQDQPTGWVRGPGALDWLVHRLSRPSIRADRSASLAGERGGRLDRFDLLIVVGLVLAGRRWCAATASTSRWACTSTRSTTPARPPSSCRTGSTAQPHAIYEFTHPHLAKYAMAWGIRLAGGNEVTGTGAAGRPVLDAVIERRWSTSDGAGAERGRPPLRGHRRRRCASTTWPATRSSGSCPSPPRPSPSTRTATPSTSPTRPAASSASTRQALEARLDDQADDGGPEAVLGRPRHPGRAARRHRHLAGGRQRRLHQHVRHRRPGVAALGALRLRRLGRARAALGGACRRGHPPARRPRRRPPGAWPAPSTGASQAERRSGAAAPSATAAGSRAARSNASERLFEADGLRRRGRLPRRGRRWSASRRPSTTAAWPGCSSSRRPCWRSRTTAASPSWTPGRSTSSPRSPTEDAVTSAGARRGRPRRADALRGLRRPPRDRAAAGGRARPARRAGDAGRGPPAWPGTSRPTSSTSSARPRTGGPTVYVVEPHGNAVFIDVPLPLEPTRLLADTQPERPARDRGELLALAGGRRPGQRRHRRQRLRLAAAGHAHGRPHGRPALPAGARPLRAAKHRRADARSWSLPRACSSPTRASA